MHKNALIVFTRIPIPHKTKTRLKTLLNGDECAALHYAFLEDISRLCDTLEYDIFLFYSDEGDIKTLDKLFLTVPRIKQHGKTLGERMNNAMEHVFQKGYEKVGLMGSDIPEIQAQSIHKGFVLLNGNDMVFGQTEDGGYYIVLTKKLCSEIFFAPIPWGTPKVWDATLNLLSTKKEKIAFTDTYQDIDTQKDLYDLAHRIHDNSSTGRYIKILGEKIV